MRRLIPRLFHRLLNYPDKLLWYYRVGRWCRERHIPIIPAIMKNRISRRYASYVSLKAVIAESVRFPHPTGIVIGDGASIGSDSLVFQQVTLGGRRIGDGKAERYPRVGSGCTIFAGAKLLGDIIIGDGATIGANAVVLQSVPDGKTAVGIPAKIIDANE